MLAALQRIHDLTLGSSTIANRLSFLTDESTKEPIPIESTDYWREMEKNRAGNLLAGARLKAGLTQAQLASQLGIRQNMVSDYERGQRPVSDAMAGRLADALDINPQHLTTRPG